MNEVIDLLESLIAQASDLADELSDEEMEQVLAVFNEAIQVIQEFEVSQGLPPIKPEIPSSEYESSNVNGFKFNPDTGELLVQFHGPYPKAAGSVYRYQGVPKYLFDILSRGAIGPKTSGKNAYHEWIKNVTPSLGGTLNALIKAGGFPFERVA